MAERTLIKWIHGVELPQRKVAFPHAAREDRAPSRKAVDRQAVKRTGKKYFQGIKTNSKLSVENKRGSSMELPPTGVAYL